MCAIPHNTFGQPSCHDPGLGARGVLADTIPPSHPILPLQHHTPTPQPHTKRNRGSVEAARELLDLGADVNVENSRGSTPLHFAAGAKARVREMCEMLLDAGADTGLPDLQVGGPRGRRVWGLVVHCWRAASAA